MSDKYFEKKLEEIIGSGKEKITDILKQIAEDQREACKKAIREVKRRQWHTLTEDIYRTVSTAEIEE